MHDRDLLRDIGARRAAGRRETATHEILTRALGDPPAFPASDLDDRPGGTPARTGGRVELMVRGAEEGVGVGEPLQQRRQVGDTLREVAYTRDDEPGCPA